MKSKNSIILLSGAGLLALAAALYWQWQPISGSKTETPSTDKREILYWTDPMVPGYRSDKPGKSPFMDMDLVPVYAENGGGDDNSVSIRPEVINNLGVRGATTEMRFVEQRLKVPGYVLRTDGGGVQVVADVFDRNADWVRPGVAASIQTDALPGREWQGKVMRAQPDIEVGARSWRVTVRLSSAEPALKTGMAVDVSLHARAGGAAVLSVPREAVIHTGQRNVVIRALDGGRFQPVEVGVGRAFGDWVEITRGLAQGERVVVSGQFLIDSEANLRAAFERLTTPEAAPAAPAAPHQH